MSEEMDADIAHLRRVFEAKIKSDEEYVKKLLGDKFDPLGPSRGLVLSVDRDRGVVTVEIGREEACKAEVNRYISIDWEPPQ